MSQSWDVGTALSHILQAYLLLEKMKKKRQDEGYLTSLNCRDCQLNMHDKHSVRIKQHRTFYVLRDVNKKI